MAIEIISNADKPLRLEWRKYESRFIEEEIMENLDIGDPIVRQNLPSYFTFESENFQIESLPEEIWPRRTHKVLIKFTPQCSGEIAETAYLCDVNTGERIAVTLRGRGMTGKAQFNVEQINIGHIMLDAVCEYKLMLRNTSDVNVDFRLNDSSRMRNVTFEPSEGVVGIGCTFPIIVRFVAEKVGQFSEHFTFDLIGIDDCHPTVSVTGRVIGPSYTVSKNAIHFGNVSFGFLYTETFEIRNQSEIPFDFELHFENDGTFEGREFNIVPNRGTVGKYGVQKITVEFIPIAIQDYRLKLFLDGPNALEEKFAIPIHATCICPKVELLHNMIDLGELFIGHTYDFSVALIDNTDYPAKFELIESSDASSLQAKIDYTRPRGIVAARKTTLVPMKIMPTQLGHLNITRLIKICGSDAPPLCYTVSALARGPMIELSTKEVNFGAINVLEDVQETVVITNNSLISARFMCAFPEGCSIFRVSPSEGTMGPNESKVITITANLDDTVQFSSELSLICTNLSPIPISVKAKGKGKTLISDIDMELIDFGYVFTGQPAVKKFVLENCGRRQQEIKWTIPRTKADEQNPPPVRMEVRPESAVLKQGEECEFEIVVNSLKPMAFNIFPQCHYTLNRQRNELYRPEVTGTFVNPMIVLKDQKLDMKYVHDVAVEENLSSTIPHNQTIGPSKELLKPIVIHTSLQNTSELPLDIDTICPNHLSVSPSSFHLEPQEVQEYDVIFDTSYKQAFASETIDEKIVFRYNGGQGRTYLPVHADLIFPNLSFSPSDSLDFGILLLNTEATQHIRVTNTSKVRADFVWELLGKEGDLANRTFDIYPIRGSIEPGETEDIHVTFFANEGEKVNGSSTFNGTAVCHVLGGPDYTLALSGASALIEYHISPRKIDFGQCDSMTPLTHELHFANKSEVPVKFQVNVPRNCGFRDLRAVPHSGTASPGETVKIMLSAIVGVPKEVKAMCFVQIGHFDEVQVDLTAAAFMPQLVMDMPRDDSDPTTGFVKERATKTNETIHRQENVDYIQAERDFMVEHLSPMIKSPKQFVRSSMKFNPLNQLGPFQGFIISKFVVDMGNIVLGERKKYDFKVQSCTPFPISFEVLADSLKGTGFSVSPTSFKDIPNSESIVLTFTFETSKRKKQTLGNVEYLVPIAFKDDLGYQVLIKAHLKMPELAFSKQHFEFEPTIIGQTRIQTLQVQNLSNVLCEFHIDRAQTTSAIKSAQPTEEAFTATPSSGVLPPSSFVNIGIAFKPGSEKTYSMQFPITIKHNKETFHVTLKGSGVQMKVVFDPPALEFPPMKGYSEPAQMTVNMINPTAYPIDVYSRQFDFALYSQKLQRENAVSTNGGSSSKKIVVSNSMINGMVSKFALCVIVHGPPKSGRSLVSTHISKYLNIPIISLKDVWCGLPADAKPSDYINTLRRTIGDHKYNNGFIIDGLDVFPEGSESEAFLLHYLKQKGTQEELQKTPFTVLPHQQLTACEQAVSYILSSLRGHYVFQVALNANEAAIQQRKLLTENEDREKRIAEQKKRMNDLFNMTEEEYEALSDQEREEIDAKREKFRAYLLTHGNDLSDFEFMTDSTKPVKPKKQTRGRSLVPSDPILLAVMMFQYTFGCIYQRLREPRDNYVVMDPSALSGSTQKVEEVEDAEAEVRSMSQENTILVDANQDIEIVMTEVFKFLPRVSAIKEKAFTLLIPPPELIVPGISSASANMKDFPSHFRIVNKELAGELPVFGEQPPAEQNDEVLAIFENQFDPMLLTKRWHLEPNEKVALNVEFNGLHHGDYKDALLFGICDSKDEIIKLPVHGSCQHPDIDRSFSVMFPNVIQKATPKTSFTYVSSNNTFVFGSLLVKEKASGKNAQTAYKQEVKLVNRSLFEAKIDAVFTQPSPKGVWSMENSTINIPPNGSSVLVILFNPTVPEVYNNTVSLQIKDNAEPIRFNVFGEGCSPVVDLSTTTLDFDKMLLKQSRTMKVDLKNSGKINSYWRIKGPLQGTNLDITPLEGPLLPGKTQSVTITFTSAKPVILKRALQFDILDQNKSRTFSSQHVNISAEAFDVAFDFGFPKGMSHLQFGCLKTGESRTVSCLLRNKGRYPAKFKTVIAKGAHSSLITATPDEGVVPVGDKGIAVTFTFLSETPVKFSNAKGISLKIFDSASNTQTAQIQVPFSAETLYASYVIEPESSLDFGAVPMNTQVTKNITISNNGVFPFDFELIPKLEISEPPSARGQVRKSARHKRQSGVQNQAPRKQRKATGKEFQVGHFLVSQSSGTIMPDSNVAIPVLFNPSIDGDYSSIIMVKISDCGSEVSNDGVPFNLTAQVLVPGVVTDDYEKIFPGQHLCLRYDINKVDTTAFLEDEQVFHFAPHVINQSTTVNVCLVNPFPIPSTVDLNIKTQGKALHMPFSISEKTVNIEPESSCCVELTCMPTVCGSFVGTFEAVARGATDAKYKALTFGLEVTGALPSITVVPQSDLNTHRNCVVNFGRTLIGFKKDRTVTLMNDGRIPAWLTIQHSQSSEFVLDMYGSVHELCLAPGQQYHLRICYNPRTLKKSQFDINVTVRDNPNANIHVTVLGEGFSEDVIFEGLSGDEGDIIFKDNVVDQPQIVTFMMKNVCQNNIRFTWINLPEITFSPRIGHLHVGQSKEITATFVSEKPAKYNGLKVSCQWTKIELADPEAPDWDDTMRQISFVQRRTLEPGTHVVAPPRDEPGKQTSRKIPNPVKRMVTGKGEPADRQVVFQSPKGPEFDLVKVTEIKPEPTYEVIPGKPKDQTLKVYAISDYIKYQLSVAEIEFAATMMFETRVAQIMLTNTSTIRFEYDWDSSKFCSLRTDYYLTRKSPFTVLPRSGFIDPGQTTKFDVRFEPEEVDDFSATLVCDIPFISKQEPPQIYVTGRSRRPLCHFNLETTDYLTAGRRHPDYTSPLPDGVRVIEMFSSGIGCKTTRKFEIINTTNSPYEIKWTCKEPSAITCDTPHALISSGKRHMASFSYTPTSVKTIESLWEFTVPEHGATISILIVGRIMPH